MKSINWSIESLTKEALKHKKAVDFLKKNRKAYRAAIKKGVFDQITSHMKKRKNKWSIEEIKKEALKYNTIKEFDEKSPGAYSAAIKRKILGDIGSHFKRVGIVSKQEKELLKSLQLVYSGLKSLRLRNITIRNKPHIKGFDLDIYDPKTNKGIEFDGRYWHSFNGLKKGREHWPDRDIYSYHQIKDGYFASKGITILHIREEDWLLNKQKCIDKCIEFLKSQ